MGNGTLLPECLDDFIDESNPVRVIDVFVDTLDLACLFGQSSDFQPLIEAIALPPKCSIARGFGCFQAAYRVAGNTLLVFDQIVPGLLVRPCRASIAASHSQAKPFCGLLIVAWRMCA